MKKEKQTWEDFFYFWRQKHVKTTSLYETPEYLKDWLFDGSPMTFQDISRKAYDAFLNRKKK